MREETTRAAIGALIGIREKGKKGGGEGRGWQADGFSMRVLARSGRTEREMNFGKREMADPVDAQSGKRRNTAVRQFPDVITGPCSRTERPGPERIPRYCFIQRGERRRVAKRLCYSVASSPVRHSREKGRENEGMYRA